MVPGTAFAVLGEGGKASPSFTSNFEFRSEYEVFDGPWYGSRDERRSPRRFWEPKKMRKEGKKERKEKISSFFHSHSISNSDFLSEYEWRVRWFLINTAFAVGWLIEVVLGEGGRKE